VRDKASPNLLSNRSLYPCYLLYHLGPQKQSLLGTKAFFSLLPIAPARPKNGDAIFQSTPAKASLSCITKESFLYTIGVARSFTLESMICWDSCDECKVQCSTVCRLHGTLQLQQSRRAVTTLHALQLHGNGSYS
jgi:hypothetical protein